MPFFPLLSYSHRIFLSAAAKAAADRRVDTEDETVTETRTSVTSRSSESSSSDRWLQEGATTVKQQPQIVKGNEVQIAPVAYTGNLTKIMHFVQRIVVFTV